MKYKCWVSVPRRYHSRKSVWRTDPQPGSGKTRKYLSVDKDGGVYRGFTYLKSFKNIRRAKAYANKYMKEHDSC